MAFSSSNSRPQEDNRAQSVVVDSSVEVDLLDRMFRMLPDIVSIYDIDAQRVIYSNRSFASVLGYVSGKKTGFDDALLYPGDYTHVNVQLQRVQQAADDEPINVTYRLKHANGSWIWFSERQVVFKRHEDGTVAQVLKCSRQTGKPVAQPVERSTDLLYYMTKYNLPNSALLLYDKDLRYILAEGDLIQRLDLLTPHLEGHTLFDSFSPEIVALVEPAYRAALAGDETQVEITTATSLIMYVRCLPFRDETGHIVAGMALCEDITDKRQTLAALLESEQRFTQFSENMHASFWMMDVERRVPLYLNPAFKDIWGIEPETAYENPIRMFEVVHPEDREMVGKTFTETFATGFHDFRFRIVMPDGKTRWLSSRAFPIYDDTGRLYRVAGISDDITQQVDNEKTLFNVALERENMRLLSQFIGTTSHELRTPLTIINTSLYLMKKMNDPAKQAERLQIIEHQVAQLTRLVSQMHMLLRVESTSGFAGVKSVSLNKIIAKLDQDLTPAIAKKELHIELKFTDDLANITADPDMVLLAAQNVLENAINYTNEGGITVETVQQDNEIMLTVRDTGIGIDPDDMPHIFERFYKADKDKRRTTVAAGLGLSITKRIMELSGGRVEVDSELGHGTTVRLFWPLGSTP